MTNNEIAMPWDDDFCHDCGVKAGETHELWCDLEQCPVCGGQALSCWQTQACPCCNTHFLVATCRGSDGVLITDADRLPWTGEWPGVAECREFGWWARREPGRPGWIPCGKDDPGASEDLNRLHKEAKWSREQQRFVRP